MPEVKSCLATAPVSDKIEAIDEQIKIELTAPEDDPKTEPPKDDDESSTGDAEAVEEIELTIANAPSCGAKEELETYRTLCARKVDTSACKRAGSS